MEKQIVHKMICLVKWLIAILVLMNNYGCLIATQSFNHGKLLYPGERLISTGMGWKYSANYFSNYEYDPVSRQEKAVFDSTRYGWFNLVIDYRIGILQKYPFGKGLEIGYHLEDACRWEKTYDKYTQENNSSFVLFSPPLLEIDTRFGLPDITLTKGIFHHNVNAGWTIGQWVDNGWFLGYAAGVEFNSTIPYLSLRYFTTATDVINDPNSSVNNDMFTTHKRTQGVRISGGVSLKQNSRFSIVPEYITPEVSLIFPNFNKTQPVGFCFTVGFRWKPVF